MHVLHEGVGQSWRTAEITLRKKAIPSMIHVYDCSCATGLSDSRHPATTFDLRIFSTRCHMRISIWKTGVLYIRCRLIVPVSMYLRTGIQAAEVLVNGSIHGSSSPKKDCSPPTKRKGCRTAEPKFPALLPHRCCCAA